MRVTTGVVLWLAAAAAATAVGLFAVGAIGTDIFGPSAGEPLSQSEVDAQLSQTSPPSTTSTPPSSVPPSTTTRPVPQAGETEYRRAPGGAVGGRGGAGGGGGV